MSEAIRRAREALGLSREALAAAVSLPAEALARYESGVDDVPGDVLWRLSETVGIPLAETESVTELERHLRVMAVRFRATSKSVSDRLRLAVARAASAARDYVELESVADRSPRHQTLVDQFATPTAPPRRDTWTSGRDLARRIRERLHVDGPVLSMLALTEKQLGILVLWQKLPADVAGYAFCDEIHGPAVVVNVNGRNQNELVGRFTLAHEISHVLFDRSDLTALSRFDAYDDFYDYRDGARDVAEVRANAFAIHLLAPESLLARTWAAAPGDIRNVMTHFGISFEAARHHLHNHRLFPLEERVTGVVTTSPDQWKNAERSELWYPAFDDIPIERRHSVAKLAFELWAKGAITTSRLREVLRAGLPHDQLTELAPLYLETLSV
jgi:Zn-dependent peptidase ImmA (M78 family)